jgi:hypothetical protein
MKPLAVPSCTVCALAAWFLLLLAAALPAQADDAALAAAIVEANATGAETRRISARWAKSNSTSSRTPRPNNTIIRA